MVISSNLALLLKNLWFHVGQRRRRQFGFLLVFMCLASFTEMLSIGAVLPFLGVLTSPERIFYLPIAQPIIDALSLTEPRQLVLPLAVTFGVAAFIAGATRLMLVWVNTRLSFAIGADLSASIYRRTLYQPYSVHLARNSSVIINGITVKTNNVIYDVIFPILTLISSSIMLMAILLILLLINPSITLLTFGFFGLIYALIIYLTRKTLLLNGQISARESPQVVKSLQEGLGGIRDILIDGSQATYCEIYSSADLPLRRSQGSNIFIGSSPRYAMEALGMIFIALLAYVLTGQSEGVDKAIPMLGALALGAQRLLPVLQQAYASLSSIQGGKASLQDTLLLLNQPLPKYANQAVTQLLPFNYCINLKDLDFRYSDNGPYILKGINLSITKGSRVGFIGVTGSGKSTLLDVVMGLLEPTNGVLEVDGECILPGNLRSWQNHIAHVPQAVFLADSSIEENIAFGVPKNEINAIRVRQAARQAQISDSIESWPNQYQTIVGERGIGLSGGQRQRIGIARALYKRADVIIFDEATSALDNETELAVMQAIESLSRHLTILIIAHRVTTLKNCTQIVELGGGQIKRISTYKDILN